MAAPVGGFWLFWTPVTTYFTRLLTALPTQPTRSHAGHRSFNLETAWKVSHAWKGQPSLHGHRKPGLRPSKPRPPPPNTRSLCNAMVQHGGILEHVGQHPSCGNRCPLRESISVTTNTYTHMQHTCGALLHMGGFRVQ